MSENTYQGGCHCRQIRFEFSLIESLENTEIIQCNCSMCEKLGYLHIIIQKNKFKLTTDWKHLNCYQFNTKVAKHYFCNNCGIKPFYQPRSHPDCWSINARCIDSISSYNLQIKGFNGKQWSENISSIT